MTDTQLISRHAAGDEEAFADLVRRHGGWVYGVARRRTGDAHLAEDVTQAVFMVLARQGKRLRRNTILPAWLFRVTQYASAKALRSQTRRQHHETKAAAMQTPSSSTDNAEWADLAPMLDALVGRLRQSDREAILLRFYRQMPFAQVGAALNISEDAARKRVDRALAKLREMVQAKGLTMSAGGLGAVLWTNMATEAAMPAGLVATITTAALTATPDFSASSSALAIAKGVTPIAAWTKVKLIAAGVSLAILLIGAATVVMMQQPSSDVSAATPALPAPRPYVAEFPDGVTVELLGVARYRGVNDLTWWSADGSPHPPLYPKGLIERRLDRIIDPMYEFAFRVTAPDDEPSHHSSLPQFGWAAGMYEPVPSAFVAVIPAEQARTNLLVRMAAGPWEVESIYDPGVLQRVGPTQARVNLQLPQQANVVKRIVLITDDGPVVKGIVNYVADVDIDSIQRIEVQSRPYDRTVEFRNISLRRGAASEIEIITGLEPPLVVYDRSSVWGLDALDIDASRVLHRAKAHAETHFMSEDELKAHREQLEGDPIQWLRSNGIDLMFQQVEERWGLMQIDSRLAFLDGAMPDDPAALLQHVTDRLAGDSGMEMGNIDGFPLSLLPANPQMPVRLAYQTREGQIGLLTIIQFVRNPGASNAIVIIRPLNSPLPPAGE